MRLSNLNIIRRIGMHKVIKVCSKCNITTNRTIIDDKNPNNKSSKNVNSSNKVITKKRVRNIRRGC